MGDDDIDPDKLLEDELARLQRQYRQMTADRMNMGSAFHPKLRKNRKTIDILQHEMDELALDLKVSKSGAHAKKDIRTGNDLAFLLVEHEHFKEDIMLERFQINELDYLIKNTQKEVLQLQSQQITDKEYSDRVIQSQQNLSQLENRLEAATKRFNVVNAENYKLRMEIEHMLKDRANFNLAWNRMITQLCNGKKYMRDLIEQSQLAYGQREEWCQKLQAMKERGQLDLMMHTQEMRELQRHLDNDMKLHNFLQIKGTTRLQKDDGKEAARKEAQRQSDMEKLANLRALIDGVKEVSEIDDPDEIIATFQRQDIFNLSVLQLIMDIFTQVKGLEVELKDYKKKIDERAAINADREEQQVDTLNALQEKLEREKDKSVDLQRQLDERQAKIDSALAGIKEMFEMMKCDSAPMLRLLGDKTVTEHTAPLYLKTMESRLRELIENVYYLERRPKDERTQKPPTKRKKREEEGERGESETEPSSAAPGLQFKTFVVQDAQIVTLRPNPVAKLVAQQPCSLCVESRELARVSDEAEKVMTRTDAVKRLAKDASDPNRPADSERLHNLSECKLPRSRRLLQKRYM